MRVESCWTKRRSCEVKRRAPSKASSTPSSHSDGLDVEVVGRLVEDEYVRLGDESACEQHRVAASARQGFEHGLAVEIQLGQHAIGSRRQVPAAAGVDLFAENRKARTVGIAALGCEGFVLCDGCGEISQSFRDHLADTGTGTNRDVLRQIGNAQSGIVNELATIQRQSSEQQGEERGLADAVASQQTHALAAIEGEVDIVEGRAAKIEAAPRSVSRLMGDSRFGVIVRARSLAQCRIGSSAVMASDICSSETPAHAKASSRSRKT